jgi:hypothetical protein
VILLLISDRLNILEFSTHSYAERSLFFCFQNERAADKNYLFRYTSRDTCFYSGKIEFPLLADKKQQQALFFTSFSISTPPVEDAF